MNVTAKTFGYPNTVIKEYNHWLVLLRPKQITIGTLVLVAKSDATHLGQLSKDEWAEFSSVSKDVEELLKTKFKAEKYNYLALMMKDPNVHFHFVPRYSSSIEFAGQTFVDEDWPYKTELESVEISNEIFEQIKQTLKS